MLLLVASGLLLRSFAKMLETDPGFQPQHVLTASFSLPARDYPTQQKADEFYSEMQRRIEALPGVAAVGFSTDIPIVGQNGGRLITAEGHVRSAGEGFLIASTYLVQGNYFQTLHIPLIRGRFFDARDERAGAPLVAIIGQSFAEQIFPWQGSDWFAHESGRSIRQRDAGHHGRRSSRRREAGVA